MQTSKPAERRDLELVTQAESKNLQRDVVSTFTGTSYKKVTDLQEAGVWERVEQLFRTAGEGFGVLARENSHLICSDSSVPTKVALLLWVKDKLSATREAIEDQAYARFRHTGGSKRVPRDVGGDARGPFQRNFAVAEREALDAAARRIHLGSVSNPQDIVVDRRSILATDSHCSKVVREGKTVQTLYTGLKQIRELYRNNGWTASQIRKYTEHELAVVWEWIDRISVPEKPAFLAVDEWDDGDRFIYLQIATLYKYAPHRRGKPSAFTIRDWRKRYKGWLKHRTRDGFRPKK